MPTIWGSKARTFSPDGCAILSPMVPPARLTFAFSSDELRPTRVDPAFEDQAQALRDAGFPVWATKPDESKVFTKNEDPSGATVVYRGWMLSAADYDRFIAAVEHAGAHPFHTREQYLHCHHLPRWVPTIADLTPETVFLPADADLETELGKLGWDGFFIKDHVKSLKTSGGSLITDPAEAARVAAEMIRVRGSIEGGFSIRRVEPLDAESERRFFVLDGRPWASDDGPIPPLVDEVARRITGSRFFSVDVASRKDGELRVVELGDGQVSDLVGWSPARFAEMWKSWSAPAA